MEPETFWTLLHDKAHWQFEIFLIVLFDVIVGGALFPFVRYRLLHHESDDEKIAKMQKQIRVLQDRLGITENSNDDDAG